MCQAASFNFFLQLWIHYIADVYVYAYIMCTSFIKLWCPCTETATAKTGNDSVHVNMTVPWNSSLSVQKCEPFVTLGS